MLTYHEACKHWVADIFGFQPEEINSVVILPDDEPGLYFITIHWMDNRVPTHKRWGANGPYEFFYGIMRAGMDHYKPPKEN